MAQTSSKVANNINAETLEDENTPLLGHRSGSTSGLSGNTANDEESVSITSSDLDKEPYIDPVRHQNIGGVISVLLLGSFVVSLT
jgi:hypothetical protein